MGRLVRRMNERRGHIRLPPPPGRRIHIPHGTIHPLVASKGSPKPRFARPGANPTLATLELIRAALRQSDGPVSRNALLAQLKVWGHSTTRQSLNAGIAFLAADGAIAEGKHGLIWVPQAKGPILDAIREGERL